MPIDPQVPIIQAAGVVGNCEDAPTLNAFASRGQASRDWKLLVFKVTQVTSEHLWISWLGHAFIYVFDLHTYNVD